MEPVGIAEETLEGGRQYGNTVQLRIFGGIRVLCRDALFEASLHCVPDKDSGFITKRIGQYGASVARVSAALAGKDLLPRGNHVPEGEILKAFQSVNG